MNPNSADFSMQAWRLGLTAAVMLVHRCYVNHNNNNNRFKNLTYNANAHEMSQYLPERRGLLTSDLTFAEEGSLPLITNGNDDNSLALISHLPKDDELLKTLYASLEELGWENNLLRMKIEDLLSLLHKKDLRIEELLTRIEDLQQFIPADVDEVESEEEEEEEVEVVPSAAEVAHNELLHRSREMELYREASERTISLQQELISELRRQVQEKDHELSRRLLEHESRVLGLSSEVAMKSSLITQLQDNNNALLQDNHSTKEELILLRAKFAIEESNHALAITEVTSLKQTISHQASMAARIAKIVNQDILDESSQLDDDVDNQLQEEEIILTLESKVTTLKDLFEEMQSEMELWKTNARRHEEELKDVKDLLNLTRLTKVHEVTELKKHILDLQALANRDQEKKRAEEMMEEFKPNDHHKNLNAESPASIATNPYMTPMRKKSNGERLSDMKTVVAEGKNAFSPANSVNSSNSRSTTPTKPDRVTTYSSSASNRKHSPFYNYASKISPSQRGGRMSGGGESSGVWTSEQYIRNNTN